MFQSLVVTLREGVEAALIVAIVLSYLKKVGRQDLARSVYAGMAAAIAVSVVGAILFRRFEVDEDRFEGWLMLIGSVFVFTMVIWMWRTAKYLKGHIETRMDELASESSSGFSFGLFAFVFLMIGREGIETVLFLGAVQLNTTAMMNFIGGVIGLGLAVAFGVLFVKGSIRVNLRKFFSITSIILIVVAAQLLISGLHELSESLVLPSSAREMAIIGPIVKNDVFFYIVILALVTLMILWQRQKAAPEPAAGANAAERRKANYKARRERLWVRALGVLALVSMVMITAQFVYSENAQSLSPPEKVFDRGKDAVVPVSLVDDRKLHRFVYDTGPNQVRFIVLKLDSGYGVAFDACQICGDKGYFQQGQQVICKNCMAAINPVSIGQSGGCNPIALESHVEGSDIVIHSAALESGAQYFGNQ